MLGKIEDKRRRGWWRMKWLDSIIDSMDMNLSKTPGNSEKQGSLAAISKTAKRRVESSLLDLVKEVEQVVIKM